MSTEAITPDLSLLPPEMLDFAILKSAGSLKLAPRLGRLSLPGRTPLQTPAFLGNTSRGAVPHISQDQLSKTRLNGVYVPFEDFVEKLPTQTPPVLEFDTPEALRRFIALPKDTLLVLGARRNPPIPTPMSNTKSQIVLKTSHGFQPVASEYYAAAVRKLQPDIVVGLADIPFGQAEVGTRRKDKMSDRTEKWTRDLIAKSNAGEKKFNIFAPFLPIDADLQSWYLEHLVDEMKDHISGMAIYDTYLLDDLPDELQSLPRLSMHTPASPQELLRQVRLGMDMFIIPFVNEATDSGIALDFTFPAPSQSQDAAVSSRQILGIDMWQESHAVSVTPLSESCVCHACTKHHRAYIQHLLSAKEMLGWVLIQMHNHSVLDLFFAGVRASIEKGTFEQDVAAFEAFYEPSLPEKSGQGPRLRGYQFRSEEHAKPVGVKKNPKAFKDLDEVIKIYGAHGQQPNAQPEVRNMIDDEALIGIVDMVETGEKVELGHLEGLKLEDDDSEKSHEK